MSTTKNLKKKVMLIGPVSSGKTTLCQCINGLTMHYSKTQVIEVTGDILDTPGEYLENRSLTHALIVTAIDADLILFLHDASSERCWFSPGQAQMFACPVLGVVTKTDLADEQEIKKAAQMLQLAGAKRVFPISCVYNLGLEDLLCYITEGGIIDGE